MTSHLFASSTRLNSATKSSPWPDSGPSLTCNHLMQQAETFKREHTTEPAIYGDVTASEHGISRNIDSICGRDVRLSNPLSPNDGDERETAIEALLVVHRVIRLKQSGQFVLPENAPAVAHIFGQVIRVVRHHSRIVLEPLIAKPRGAERRAQSTLQT